MQATAFAGCTREEGERGYVSLDIRGKELLI